ncbi:MAG: flavodoxin-dependent (E)-4-hydroxy-3-methylbut-2-enyl-diphosphate synthase [Planctomycetes bacterium]|nr:flavodoxin-dependent (E)-4-hydroxy-3-methylbut-2-enyl-diphosphate synthase [Planctomycetota bacterium]
MEHPAIQRRTSRQVHVGPVAIGGGAPVSVQSMTNTPTRDVEATVAQIGRLAGAGADIVRVAVPTQADTAALGAILARSPVPIVADVHFHFERALEAVAAGVHKIRLNPGNIADRDRVRRVIDACGERGIPIRIGVNEGSIVERRDGAKRAAEEAAPLVDLMMAKLESYLAIFDACGFGDLVLAAKSPDALTCIEATRRMARRWDYPLHLGVTHAGDLETGIIRSSAALGALLADGIGETIRISLAADPVEEVRAARELLAALRLRAREEAEIIACPTCGRIQIDLLPLVAAIRRALRGRGAGLKVAVMGCVVNGPGEAADAHVAVCGGKGSGVLYVDGRRVRTVAEADIVAAVVAEVERYGRRAEAQG